MCLTCKFKKLSNCYPVGVLICICSVSMPKFSGQTILAILVVTYNVFSLQFWFALSNDYWWLSLVTCTYFLLSVYSLVECLDHLPAFKLGCLLITKFWVFALLDFSYVWLIMYIFCKCSLPVCDLHFYFAKMSFGKAKAFNIDEM